MWFEKVNLICISDRAVLITYMVRGLDSSAAILGSGVSYSKSVMKLWNTSMDSMNLARISIFLANIMSEL